MIIQAEFITLEHRLIFLNQNTNKSVTLGKYDRNKLVQYLKFYFHN